MDCNRVYMFVRIDARNDCAFRWLGVLAEFPDAIFLYDNKIFALALHHIVQIFYDPPEKHTLVQDLYTKFQKTMFSWQIKNI